MQSNMRRACCRQLTSALGQAPWPSDHDGQRSSGHTEPRPGARLPPRLPPLPLTPMAPITFPSNVSGIPPCNGVAPGSQSRHPAAPDLILEHFAEAAGKRPLPEPSRFRRRRSPLGYCQADGAPATSRSQHSYPKSYPQPCIPVVHHPAPWTTRRAHDKDLRCGAGSYENGLPFFGSVNGGSNPPGPITPRMTAAASFLWHSRKCRGTS
jgi:hypothetical protein